MKTTTKNLLVIAYIAIVFGIVDVAVAATSLYWKHQAVVHHAARYEASSWGNVSFHWNDDSAQTPFMDTSFVTSKK